MLGFVSKKNHKKKMQELSVAAIDLHGKALNFAKLILELLRLYEHKQLSRRKFAREIFTICNEFITKLGGNGGKRNGSK